MHIGLKSAYFSGLMQCLENQFGVGDMIFAGIGRQHIFEASFHELRTKPALVAGQINGFQIFFIKRNEMAIDKITHHLRAGIVNQIEFVLMRAGYCLPIG